MKHPSFSCHATARMAVFFLLALLLLPACENRQNELDDSLPPTDGTPILAEWPVAATLYEGHVLALVDSLSSHRATLTFLSLFDWSDQPSANHPDLGDNCTLLASGYEEPSAPSENAGTSVSSGTSGIPGISDTLTPWQIPTSAQAKALREHYSCSKDGTPSDALSTLNALFASLGYPEFATTEGSQNARYLCDEGRKSFSLVDGTSISQAGSSKSDYHLRLVHTIEVYIR